MLLSKHSSVLALLLVACGLSACGFQLRSEPNIPVEMSRTYISTNDNYSLFYRKLRDELTRVGVEVVDSPSKSSAVFSILADNTDQRVLSVSARNVPREYEVYYTIFYSVESGEQSVMAPQSLTLTRDYTYDETLVLGKAREEELLREAIADDLVRIILKQLSSL
jgi:LPS-assembly lipoprotein